MALLAPFSLDRCFAYNLCFRNPAFRHFTSQHLDFLRVEKCWHVSSHGRCCDTRGRISRGTLHDSGYFRVNVWNNLFYVHRVVALTFLDAPSNNAWQVHHRDGNIVNNRVDNLEYVTPKQNADYFHANAAGTRCQPLHSKAVLWRRAGSDDWTQGSSILSTARQLGLSQDAVSRCCHNHSSAKGFEFRFAKMNSSDLPEEEWRPMLDPETGFEVPGRRVSSLGRVQSCRGIIHRGHLSRHGYYHTKLSFNSLQASKRVHRLVAYAFLGKPPTEHQNQINHKDGNKANNAVENLEYVTPSQNILHYHSLTKANSGQSLSRKSQCRPVWSRAVKSNHDWQWHASMSHAAAAFGLCPSGIWACCNGRYRQTGGFEFRKADPGNTAEVIEGEEWRKVDFTALLRDKSRRANWSAKLHTALVRLKLKWNTVMWFKPGPRHHGLGHKDRNHVAHDAIRTMKVTSPL